MNIEEIENRIIVCEKRAMEYREVNKTSVANKYDSEKYKWEKLLSNLELLNERKINELLDYKKGYYHKKQVIDKATNWTIKYQTEWCQEDEVIRDLKQLLDILKEVSE